MTINVLLGCSSFPIVKCERAANTKNITKSIKTMITRGVTVRLNSPLKAQCHTPPLRLRSMETHSTSPRSCSGQEYLCTVLGDQRRTVPQKAAMVES